MAGYKSKAIEKFGLTGEVLSNHNSKVIEVTNPRSPYFGQIVKVMRDEFHGESPYSDRTADERAKAYEEAYKMFPHIFPKTKRLDSGIVVQEPVDVSHERSMEHAVSTGDYRSLRGMVRNLNELWKRGYVHGDIYGYNVHEDYLSFDNETFGPGDPEKDIDKMRRMSDIINGDDGVRMFDEALREVGRAA